MGLLQMTSFFVLQVPLMAVERWLLLRGKCYLYVVLISASPLFVNPVADVMSLFG